MRETRVSILYDKVFQLKIIEYGKKTFFFSFSFFLIRAKNMSFDIDSDTIL